MRILAIDQGTSGTKAVVWDAAQGVIGRAEVAVRPRYLADGLVEQDPEELWQSVLQAGRAALGQANGPIAAVALANQGETVLAWDHATGRPSSSALVWQDSRAQDICQELAAHGAELTRRTGLKLDPYFSAPKMVWLHRNPGRGQLAVDEKNLVVTTIDAWLMWRLTGEFVTDRATASRSLLLDLDDDTWTPDLVAKFGLSSEPAPRIVANDEIVGLTHVFANEAVGGVPVVGILDQPAALFAQSCLQPGAAKCTYGTGAFLLTNTGQLAVRSTTGLTTSVAWQVRKQTVFCLDGQVYAVASAVRWLQDLGLITGPAELDRVVADDDGGVTCVPALAGLAAPWWQSESTATLTGLRLATGRGEIVRALLNGIAAQVAEVCQLTAAELGQPLQVLRVDGGLTRSAALMQAQADIAQLPVEVCDSPDATALGAVGMALLALQPDLELAGAVPTSVDAARGEGAGAPGQSRHIFEPQWSNDRAVEFRARWGAVLERELAAAPNAAVQGQDQGQV